MDGLLQQLHALQTTQVGRAQPEGHTPTAPALQSTQATADSSAARSAQQLHSRPFAQVDEVSMNSPASTAGLQVGSVQALFASPSKTMHSRSCASHNEKYAPLIVCEGTHNCMCGLRDIHTWHDISWPSPILHALIMPSGMTTRRSVTCY